MSYFGIVKIARLEANWKFIMRPIDRPQDQLPPASRRRTVSVIPFENGIQVNGLGMDPVFTGVTIRPE
jgi:hypothetical protein